MLVHCPKCNHAFEAKRAAYGTGARYALKWNRLPEIHLELISWWLVNFKGQALTKEFIAKNFYSPALRKSIDEDGINGRMSELLTWDIVRRLGKGRYELTDRAQVVVQHRGNLAILKTLSPIPAPTAAVPADLGAFIELEEEAT